MEDRVIDTLPPELQRQLVKCWTGKDIDLGRFGRVLTAAGVDDGTGIAERMSDRLIEELYAIHHPFEPAPPPTPPPEAEDEEELLVN